MKNSNYKVFLFFFVISSFFWVLIKFSKIYTSDQTFSVEFTSVPDKLVWNDLPDVQMNLRTTASGFSLLNYRFFGKKLKLNLAYLRKGDNDQYYILPKNQFGQIAQQFSNNAEILLISPDTIKFDFSKKITKKVAVILNDSITLAKSYKFKSPIKIDPDSIEISGPESVMNSITNVQTKKIIATDLRSNTESTVNLIQFDDNRVKLDRKQVKVHIEVEKFTQNQLELPINVINVPEGYLLQTFPNKVKVVFNTGLSDFESVNQLSFKASVDYNLINQNQTTIPIKIEIFTDKALLIRTEPSSVEFILRKIEEDNQSNL